MSTGLAVLHCLLKERQNLSVLHEADIDVTFFQGDEVPVYNFIESHYLTHDALPQIETVEVETEVTFPQFPNEPLGYWIEAIQRRHKANLVAVANKEMKALAVSGDLDTVKDIARKLVIDLEKGAHSARIVTAASISPAVLVAHNIRQKAVGISGVPFGIPYLDMISDGAQGGDTVALAGRPSAGKSFLALFMANYSYMLNEIPLFVTLEMPPIQCIRRILGMRAQISVTQTRLGRLSHWNREKLAHEIHLFQNNKRLFHFLHGRLDTTVEDLFIRVRELRPTVLYVDGAYLLRSRSRTTSRWERVAETAEFLKMIAAEFNIPVIATYQFSRKGSGLDGIAYSDAISQLASIVIGLENFDKKSDDGDEPVPKKEMKQYKRFTLLKGREGERGVLKILYDMERSIISQVEVVESYEDEQEEEYHESRERRTDGTGS